MQAMLNSTLQTNNAELVSTCKATFKDEELSTCHQNENREEDAYRLPHVNPREEKHCVRPFDTLPNSQ